MLCRHFFSACRVWSEISYTFSRVLITVRTKVLVKRLHVLQYRNNEKFYLSELWTVHLLECIIYITNFSPMGYLFNRDGSNVDDGFTICLFRVFLVKVWFVIFLASLIWVYESTLVFLALRSCSIKF